MLLDIIAIPEPVWRALSKKPWRLYFFHLGWCNLFILVINFSKFFVIFLEVLIFLNVGVEFVHGESDPFTGDSVQPFTVILNNLVDECAFFY